MDRGPGEEAGRRRPARWPQRYANRLFFGDLLVISFTLICFRMLSLPDAIGSVSWDGPLRISYWAVLIVVGVIWLIALDAAGTRDQHTVGHGIVEYQRIVRASLAAWASVLAIAFFLQMDLARSLFLIALPFGVVLLMLSRWTWRQWLRRQQRHRSFVHRAVVIGEQGKIAHVTHMIDRSEGTGLHLVGAITAGGERNLSISGLPVVGAYGDAADAVAASDADTVIIAGADDLDPMTMRRLSWEMADRDVDWVVAPALTDIAGSRIHARPVAGLPLVHVSFPKMEGANRFFKRAFDLAGSLILIVLLSPVMAAVAVAVKVDSHGPLLYTQERIGRRGKPFRMIKFRSMRADADDQLAGLLDVQGTATRPLFKVIDDPRVTRVGRFMRRHSLDELPQLFNVVRGELSLVGPRPQRAEEVALYDDAAHRRLLVKPGMSGLWQVSGRSKLDWEDALRLDLYYVENWSFTQDIIILLRTVRAVVAPGTSAH
ncbi:MAG: sugar transferase [Microbacterium sp.]